MEQGNTEVCSDIKMNADSIQQVSVNNHVQRPASHGFNVAKIIQQLPADATPAQQDSAVQAHLPERQKFRSTCPDTLNIPGWNVKKWKADLTQLPSCYEDTMFGDSVYYHPELPYRSRGIVAEPEPYLLRNDDWITAILLFCFFVMLNIFSKSRKYIVQQFSDFFFMHTEKSSFFDEEAGREKREALFLLFQTSLLVGLFFFDFTQESYDMSMWAVSSHLLLGSYVVVCLCFFGLKHILYQFVNWIFFDKQQRRMWAKAYYFLLSAEGVLFFPLAMLTVYFNLSLENTALVFLFLLFGVKILLLYKYYTIFFSKIYGLLHLIVYFCGLEMLPLCGLWQALIYTNDILL